VPVFDVVTVRHRITGGPDLNFSLETKMRILRGLILRGTVVAAALCLVVASSLKAEVKEVPQRSDIDNQYKWRLEDIYPDTAAWFSDFNRLDEQMDGLSDYEGRLGESAETLYQCLALRDSLDIILWRLYVYAFMKQDEDTRVPEYQQMGGQIAALRARYGSKESFVDPEILSIPEDRLTAFLKNDPDLGDYKFYISNLIRSKAHILSPGQEQILALASNATRGASDIFGMMTNADLKFPSITDEKGDEIQLTRERYYDLLESTDRRVRLDANKAYNESYMTYFNALGAALSSSVNSDWFYAQARNYDTCLEYKLDDDNIPTSVFYNLIDAVNANLGPLHKWTALRKKILGLDEIHPYDLFVPLVPEAKEVITYDDAVKTVIEGLQPMGESYLKDLKMAFNSGWIDVYETEGKSGGAYSWGSYSTHPYVMLNYNDNLENVFTVAHELGHALHSYYSKKTQPYINSGYATFVAEVASTTNESTLLKYLLDKTTDKKKKMYLLNYYIQQIIGTFYTQVMFSEFELAIHRKVEKGGALSAQSMREIYRDIYQKYRGPELVIDDWNDIGGLRIPHFYRSYYVFQYATSYAAAQAVSQKILSGDKKALEAYLEFLTWGGNDYPVNQLQKIGVDMTTSGPVDATIKRFSELVDEMERLLTED
jgi:oligoendopeptidase F